MNTVMSGRKNRGTGIRPVPAVFPLILLILLFPASGSCAGLLFILDGSASMAGESPGQPRIEAVKSAVAETLSTLPPDTRTGVMVFGHRRPGDCRDVEMIHAPAPLDRRRILAKLDRMAPVGMTPLALSLRRAGGALKGIRGPVSLVVVADGQDTCLGDPCAAARDLKRRFPAVSVEVIGFQVDPAERPRLACVAQSGGGRYVEADDEPALRSALARLVRPARRRSGEDRPGAAPERGRSVAAQEMRRVRVEVLPRETKLYFTLTDGRPPKTRFTKENRPRVVCEFPRTRRGRGVPRELSVESRLVRAVRLSPARGGDLRAVIDLVPGVDCELRHFIFPGKETYLLVVTEAG